MTTCHPPFPGPGVTLPEDGVVVGQHNMACAGVIAADSGFKSAGNLKPSVKSVDRAHVHSGSMITLELIGSDVDDQFLPPKPRVRFRSVFAAYVIKACLAVLLKIVGEKKAGVTAATQGKSSKDGWQRFRIVLDNGLPERAGKECQFVYISVDPSSGSIFTSKHWPFDVDAILRENSELRKRPGEAQ